MNRHIKKLLIIFGQAFLIVIMLFPFAYMFSTSLKRNIDVYVFPIKWIPRPIVVLNYLIALKDLHILQLFRNSLIVSTISVIFSLFINSLAGYSFARKNFPGKKILFMIVLASMMVPFQAILIPLFLITKRLGLYNTYAAIIIPWCAHAYGIFLMKQYISTIPEELDCAAKVDGCPDFLIFLRVILPICTPILVSLSVFIFIWTWTDLLLPLIMINSSELTTIELGLSQLGGKYGGARINIPVTMAGCTIAVIPPILFFIIGGRSLMKGQLLQGGIKG